MKSLRLAGAGSLVLASAVLLYAQHGHGVGHTGSPGGGMGHSSAASSGHNGESNHTQSNQGAQSNQGTQTKSQGDTPKQLQDPDSKLSEHLQNLLPSGTTPQQACSGFKNLGQCVAAIHVSHNLGVSFTDLKTKMTGSSPESLGKAIQDLKPTADSKAETKKANQQAQDDMKQS
jgi:hypothetical protein